MNHYILFQWSHCDMSDVSAETAYGTIFREAGNWNMVVNDENLQYDLNYTIQAFLACRYEWESAILTG